MIGLGSDKKNCRIRNNSPEIVCQMFKRGRSQRRFEQFKKKTARLVQRGIPKRTVHLISFKIGQIIGHQWTEAMCRLSNWSGWFIKLPTSFVFRGTVGILSAISFAKWVLFWPDGARLSCGQGHDMVHPATWVDPCFLCIALSQSARFNDMSPDQTFSLHLPNRKTSHKNVHLRPDNIMGMKSTTSEDSGIQVSCRSISYKI